MGATPQVVDWNSDGNRDLVSGERNGYFNYFLANPDTLLASCYKMRLSNGDTIDVGSNSEPQVVDWDRDGRKDLLIGNETGNIRVYLNIGTNQAPAFQNFTLVYAGSSPISEFRNSPRVVDLDNDGKRDLVVGANSGYLTFYRNIGSDTNPTFGTARETLKTVDGVKIQPRGIYSPRASFCDWNNDGVIDFVVSGYDGYIEVYLGITRDVGTARITSPGAQVDSGVTVTPACTVFNAGEAAETFVARMKIGSAYNNTVTVTNLAAGARAYVTFPAWTATQRGNVTVSCSTEMVGDQYPADDKKSGTTLVAARDVGVTRIVVPGATADSGTTCYPQCSVYNHGNVAATYTVRCRIGSTYNQTATVTNQSPGTLSLVTFAAWSPGARGTVAVSCSTQLTGDFYQDNDKLAGSVLVTVKDVTPTRIVAPAGTFDSGSVTTPACSVDNPGSVTVDYVVRMRIGTQYNATASVTGHAPGTQVYVTFPEWTAAPRGLPGIRCSTELAGDAVPANNRKVGSVTVAVHDVSTTRIVTPAGRIDSGTAITPLCSLSNRGTTTETYTVRLTIGTGYNETRSVVGHPPGTTIYVTFPNWTAGPRGDLVVACSTALATDMVPANDRQEGYVIVGFAWERGWKEVTSIPASPSGKPVKDGGWLAAMAGSEFVYGTKGNKTGDFHVYDAAGAVWVQKASIPNGVEAKPLSKGASGCADGNGTIYAAKGNNTVGFWKYAAARDSWFQVANVPLGASNKRVKGGGDMVYVPEGSGYVYFLKGYNNEFYRYSVASDSWQTLPPVPNPKWAAGSFLVYDDDHTIYAHHAKEHALWMFDLTSQNWLGVPVTGMPYLSRLGSSKKSKDGGSGAWYDGALYALKGGNTQEFWRYTPSTDLWDELDTMPAFGSTGSRKKIKAGGDIVSFGQGAFFAQKGNKCNEFWRYVMPDEALGRGGNAGVMAAASVRGDVGLSIAPNPMRSGFATVRLATGHDPNVLRLGSCPKLSIYDASGRLVLTRTLTVEPEASNVVLDLRTLTSGVYVLKLGSGTRETATRFVVR